MLSELKSVKPDLFSKISDGTHLCYFYEKREDLIDILIPYFKEGLEENFYCMWITPKELSRSEALKSLNDSIPNFQTYLQRNQIKIIPYNEWYLKDKTLNLDKVLEEWIKNLNQALEDRYNGLRVSGDLGWLGEEEFKRFVDYEIQVNSIIGNYRMSALCTYPVEKFNKFQILDIANSHQYVLTKTDNDYKIIENLSRKRREQQEIILQSNLEKIQKMEIIGILTSGIAHDLSQFLTIIQGYADLSLKEMEKKGHIFEYINKIHDSANDASDLIKQIKDFSTISKPDKKIININKVIEKKIDLLQILIPKYIKFKTYFHPDIWNIFVDPGKFEQIFLNLITNAKDAIQDSGEIIIRTENSVIKEQFQVNNFNVSPGNYVKLIIEDNGEGMEKKIIERIFEPFFTTKEPGQGTGLGLPMTYNIVKEYRGWIDVFSEPDKGTKFSIYLPAHFSD
ncbi:hypothetical protein LCGC14_1494650 [marine sediment metagenome]|uniref:Histidine kinase domain-containing protein n=1 Tax=marine sediment metagenome TaxID=412755 RepID=A0A0F9M7C0_9ZZZZ